MIGHYIDVKVVWQNTNNYPRAQPSYGGMTDWVIDTRAALEIIWRKNHII